MKFIPASNSLRIALVAATCGLASVTLLAQSGPPPFPIDPATPIPQPGQLPPNQQLPNPNNPANPSPAQQDSIGAPGLTGQMMRDKNFIRDAIAANLAEIEFGQLASQKAQDADVKAFAQKMVADHTDFNQQMKALADSLGYMTPKKLAKDDQATYDKLKALPPADFEAQYITAVAMKHRQTLHLFREEFVATNDNSIHDAIMKAGPTMRDHAQAVEKLAKDKNVQLPARQRPAPSGQ